MNRFTRKLVSIFSIVAVIFAQLAVSAYACPMQFMGLDEVGIALGATESDSGVTDAVSPALCQKHSEHGQQNVNDTPQALAFVSFNTALVIETLVEPNALSTTNALTPFLLHATSPPLSIRNCCFLI